MRRREFNLRNNRLPLAAVILLASLTAAGCRRDMQDEPKYKPLAESQFFNDHRSARPAVDDTVPRGYLKTNLALYTGKMNGQDIDYFPFPITRADLEQGQNRFQVYCTPCHGRLGDGDGMIVKRGYRQPPSYHADRLMKAPVGHFFDVMSNGFGAMPSYASRVPVQDRWRIAAYIRALQLSENAKITDVPEEQRSKLMAASEKEDVPEPNPPNTGTSYTPPPPEPAAMQGLRGAELPNPYSGEIPPATTQKSAAAQATGGSK